MPKTTTFLQTGVSRRSLSSTKWRSIVTIQLPTPLLASMSDVCKPQQTPINLSTRQASDQAAPPRTSCTLSSNSDRNTQSGHDHHTRRPHHSHKRHTACNHTPREQNTSPTRHQTKDTQHKRSATVHISIPSEGTTKDSSQRNTNKTCNPSPTRPSQQMRRANFTNHRQELMTPRYH